MLCSMTTPQGGVPLVRHSWFAGGALLLASVALAATQSASLFIPAVTLQTALFAAALLVFAFGRNRSESVTGRRPLGTAALVLLAAWVLARIVVTPMLAIGIGDALPGALVALGTVDPFVKFGLSLVAVVQIKRANVVPRPWNWAPAIALAALTAAWVLSLAPAAAIDQATAQNIAVAVSAVDGLIRVCNTVVLGVVAILLADRAGQRSNEGGAALDVTRVDPEGVVTRRPEPL